MPLLGGGGKFKKKILPAYEEDLHDIATVVTEFSPNVHSYVKAFLLQCDSLPDTHNVLPLSIQAGLMNTHLHCLRSPDRRKPAESYLPQPGGP